MSNIGGTITGVIQLASYSPNASGEQVPTWKDALRLTGFLDMMSGSAGYMAYNAKIQESTHVFLCDYAPLPKGVDAETAAEDACRIEHTISDETFEALKKFHVEKNEAQ